MLFCDAPVSLPIAVQMLSSITAAYGTKLLGDKQANEASMAIRDCLCAAAAAHSYRRPQVLLLSAEAMSLWAAQWQGFKRADRVVPMNMTGLRHDAQIPLTQLPCFVLPTADPRGQQKHCS
jgi:hypothetical protein